MQLTMFKGYPDLVGRRQTFCGSGAGPAVYNSTTGDVLLIPGYERYIDCVLEIPLDPTGTYYGVAKPSVAGARATWAIFYYTAAGAQVSNATVMSTFNFVVSGFMGEF